MSLKREARQQPVYNWVDVKEKFWKCSEDLKLGELVHDNLFGLFEAMSAIEIMDPKMDAGMICNRKRKVIQLPEAIQEGKVKIKDFSEEEVLGIIDEIAACFVAWLDGQSLVQSVFTCMYCHDPYVLEDVVLKAMCIAILKMVDIIRTVCTKAKVFEEEDFQPMTYGFKLATDVTELRVSGMLREAEDEITKRVKVYQANEDETSAQQTKKCKAIKIRLKFWRSFYCTLLSFEKSELGEISKCQDLLDIALSSMNEIKQTVCLGLISDHTKDYYMPGFDVLVNQRLLPPSFPRQAEIFQRDKTFEYMEALINRLKKICTVITECHTLHMILEFLYDFSKRVPCVLSRSLLQLIIYSNNRVFGKYALSDMIRESIKLFNGTPAVAELSPLTSVEAKNVVNDFISKSVKSITNLIEAYGHNRARQREKLGNLLEELGELQAEADKADQELHHMLQAIDSKRQHLACFESWVLYHSLFLMIQHILLGFELELFNPHEFHYVYWYLDYLFGWANNCLHRAESLLGIQEQYVDKKCGKKEKKKRKEILTACSEQIKEHKSLRLLFNGMKDLCLGNLKAYEGFNLDGKIRHPEPFFDSEKIRFDHRFQAFQAIDTHQSASYKDYKDITSPPGQEYRSSKDLYTEAKLHFERAMKSLQYIEQVDEEGVHLMKVAKTNFIVMKLAASGHKQDSKKSPEWDFSVHQSYPLIKLS
ncbi:N-alpha-acetyltransferase 35, NatC auxiliary subunit-like isoform X2 [Hydractinia symbiolongicarpus]|nr:N-alpha-acetyltransferase 35, NatC auxiliary subunit-like isoform X2 [Hydractinia symbiolongicarpus]